MREYDYSYMSAFGIIKIKVLWNFLYCITRILIFTSSATIKINAKTIPAVCEEFKD